LTVPYSHPKRVLQRRRSSASSFNFQYPIFSLRSSISCLRLIPCIFFTSTLPSIFLQLSVLVGSPYSRCDHPGSFPFYWSKIFLSFWVPCNASLFLIWLVQMISILLQLHISNDPGISDILSEVTVQSCTSNVADFCFE
jgi:hypothetical protein